MELELLLPGCSYLCLYLVVELLMVMDLLHVFNSTCCCHCEQSLPESEASSTTHR